MGIGNWIKKKGEEQADKWREEKMFKVAKRKAYEAEYKKARREEGMKAEVHAARSRAMSESRRDAGRHGPGYRLGLNIGELPSVAGKIQKNADKPIFDIGGGGRGSGTFDPFGTDNMFGSGGSRKKKGRRQPKEQSFW